MPLLTVSESAPLNENPAPPVTDVPDNWTLPEVTTAALVFRRTPFRLLLLPCKASVAEPLAANVSVLPLSQPPLLDVDVPDNDRLPELVPRVVPSRNRP